MTAPTFARVTSFLLLAFLASGCATLFRGSNQSIKFITDPGGATVNVDGKSYKTPATVLMKRNKPHDVLVSLEGYQSIRFKLQANWDAGGAGAVAADAIIPGGSVLFIIDTIAGADRQFNEIATIKLPRAIGPTTEPITLYEFKGKLMMKPDYDAAVEQDKLFAKKKKKDKKGATQPAAATQPTAR